MTMINDRGIVRPSDKGHPCKITKIVGKARLKPRCLLQRGQEGKLEKAFPSPFFTMAATTRRLQAVPLVITSVNISSL